jgi:hypothetical protein
MKGGYFPMRSLFLGQEAAISKSFTEPSCEDKISQRQALKPTDKPTRKVADHAARFNELSASNCRSTLRSTRAPTADLVICVLTTVAGSLSAAYKCREQKERAGVDSPSGTKAKPRR